ncbi:hypothetical protein KIH27_12715 [Mycobacterium sp. M1]|uniref:Secreted protein n=1 Tax=Mycolicibacter acidiphilus TaxID=2835306 RepID=A0ABS5RJI4_9MYCO|nr:hypothetical protein [Mycolicibacter acidiphilus]MBS9534448.1 hypothetical protein [Mycolicibacter acidiphilus]
MMKSQAIAAATFALAGGAAVAAAALAGAEVAASPDFTGTYAYAYNGGSNGTPFSTTWTVTPCGDGCAHIVTASGLTDTNAHLSGGKWVFQRYDDAGILCDNHKLMGATVEFRVDPRTLQGELQPQGTPCGGTSRTTTFTLAKIG